MRQRLPAVSMSPLGAKGAGEASAVASATAAVDELSPLGITHLDMPLTGERVWRAIREKRNQTHGSDPSPARSHPPGDTNTPAIGAGA